MMKTSPVRLLIIAGIAAAAVALLWSPLAALGLLAALVVAWGLLTWWAIRKEWE